MIYLEKKDKKIIITGDIQELPNSFIIFLNSKYNNFNQEKNFLCFDIDSSEETINKLIKAFDRYNIKYKFNQELQKENLKIILEQEKFKEFSVKALNIRNNRTDFNELNDFKESLENNLIGRKLYDLQFLSAYHLAFSQNACNFSVPGAGKTSIVYGAYAYLKNLSKSNKKHVDKILIIGPLSSFKPWEDEYKSCFNENPQVKRILNMNQTERKNYFQGLFQDELILISYITAANSAEDIKIFLENNNVMVVLDEAHKIKNTDDDAYISNCILSFAKNANSRVVLTGTPAPNGYQDIYNLYKFIWPENNIVQFNLNQLRRMSNPKETPRTKRMIENLIDNIKPFYLRIKKTDLNDIPTPIENPMIPVDMDIEQKKIYEYIEEKTIKKLRDDNPNTQSNLSKTIRLMQCATNPHLLKKALDNPEDDILIDDIEIYQLIKNYNNIPPKFTKCIENIKEILKKPGSKVVVWAYFIDNLYLLKSLLNKENLRCEILYGGTPIESDTDESGLVTREKIIDKFNENNDELRILIANPYAASESISLHKVCHNAIYLERNFNAAIFLQSKDRIHRYGLKKNDEISYYYLGSSNSIDEAVDIRLKEKISKMMKLIESEEIPLFKDYFNNNMDNEDVKEILEEYANRNI